MKIRTFFCAEKSNKLRIGKIRIKERRKRMDKWLMCKLREITTEEQAYLDGYIQVKRDIYTLSGEVQKTEGADATGSRKRSVRQDKFEVDCQRFLQEGKLITVRHHSRFIEFPLHKHNYIEIMYVCSGEITHYIDGKELVMQEGDLLLLNQHVRHGIKRAGMDDVGVNFIVLPEFFDIPFQMMRKQNIIADFLLGILRQNNPIPQYLNFQLRGQKAISNLMENMIASIVRERMLPDSDSPLAVPGYNNKDVINQYSMGLVFLYLIDHIDTLSDNSSQSYEDIVVQATARYIDAHYRTASLSRIADDFKLSLSVISRMIKKSTGFTFQELLVRKRFQKAVMFLVETELPVEEIAVNIGYENHSYFYRQFKARYGMTPSQYRRMHKDDNAIKI